VELMRGVDVDVLDDSCLVGGLMGRKNENKSERNYEGRKPSEPSSGEEWMHVS